MTDPYRAATEAAVKAGFMSEAEAAKRIESADAMIRSFRNREQPDDSIGRLWAATADVQGQARAIFGGLVARVGRDRHGQGRRHRESARAR